jgi:hypothetical protein
VLVSLSLRCLGDEYNSIPITLLRTTLHPFSPQVSCPHAFCTRGDPRMLLIESYASPCPETIQFEIFKFPTKTPIHLKHLQGQAPSAEKFYKTFTKDPNAFTFTFNQRHPTNTTLSFNTSPQAVTQIGPPSSGCSSALISSSSSIGLNSSWFICSSGFTVVCNSSSS